MLYSTTTKEKNKYEKILIIITKGDVGGAQVSVFNLAKKLKEKKLNVTVGFGEGEFLENKLKEWSIPYVKFKYLRRTYNPIRNLLFIMEIKRYLDKHPVDTVHFNSSNALFGAIGARLSKCRPKTIFTYRGLSLIDPEYTRSKLKRAAYRLIFKTMLCFIDKTVFVSKANEQYCELINLAKNSRVIYNGLDPDNLKFLSKEEARTALSAKINIPIDSLWIGSIGRISHQKNYEFLIKQAIWLKEKFSTVKICVIGDGPETNKIKELIHQNNLQSAVYLAGALPDAYQYLKAFDIFVLPSRYEGLPITLIEALFAGLPILATDVGGNKEVLNESDCLYKLDGERDFREKITNLLLNSRIRDELKRKALERAKLFSIEKTAGNYISLYQQS